MSGFAGGDRAAHYAFGAARSIHVGEWDRFLVLLAGVIRDRQRTLDSGQEGPAPSLFSFLPGAPDQPRQGADQP